MTIDYNLRVGLSHPRNSDTDVSYKSQFDAMLEMASVPHFDIVDAKFDMLQWHSKKKNSQNVCFGRVYHVQTQSRHTIQQKRLNPLSTPHQYLDAL
ncbi:MAG: hypothetical protein ACJAR9_001854 [Celeribacter sp.]|jgi:hypothetical protein